MKFNFFSKLKNAMRSAKLWVSALAKSLEENDLAAKADLDELVGLLESLKKPDPEVFLLKSRVEYSLGNYSESLSDLDKFRILLASSSRYNTDEKNHLCCYGDRILEKLRRIYSPAKNYQYDGDFTKVNLRKTRKYIQRNFPL